MSASLITATLKNKIFWYLLSRYFSLALQFFASIFLAVKLAAFYFGIWSFMLLLINIGSNCNWGIGNATTILLVQYKENKKLCQNYTLNSLILVFITSLLPIAIMLYDRIKGIEFFTKYHLGNLIYAVAAVVVLQYLCNFFINILRIQNRIFAITIQQTLWPLIMVSLLFCASGKVLLNLLALGYVLTLAVAVIFFMVIMRTYCNGTIKLDLLRHILGKSFFLFLYNACFLSIMLSTKLLISYFYPVTDFGYFAFAFSLAQGVVLLTDSLIFLIFPKMIDLLKGDNTQKISSELNMMRKNYIVPLHFLFYMILAFSSIFFYFLPQYSKSFLPFILILFTLIMYSNCFGYSSYLLAQNKEKSFSLLVAVALLTNISLSLIAVQVFKVKFEYVILGTLLVYFLYSIAVNTYALYCLGEHNITVYLRKNFEPKSMIIYLVTLCLVLTIGCHWEIFLGMLTIFSVSHLQELSSFVRGATKLMRNDKLINI